MARMIPDDGPIANGSRTAEPLLYRLFATQLPEDVTVIHSLPWLSQAVAAIDPQHRPTGEIDFLILHPVYGMLAIEVKGGYYRFDRNALVLLSTGERIDPVAQVRRGVHALARWLYAAGAPARKIGYAIALPQADLRGQPLPPAYLDRTAGVPVSITIDRNDLPQLADRILALLQYWHAALHTPRLTPIQIDQIVATLCPVADYRPHWADRIAEDTARWLVLTDEQAQCLRYIAQQPRVVLTGRSGTGKTLLALTRARDLAVTGQPVLFLAYNTRLVQRLQQELANTSVSVMTFHKLCRLAQTQLTRSAVIDDAWYREHGPRMLQEAIDTNIMPEYVALVIDEAQVFAPEWIATLTQWFADRPILASSDETQVFAFEHCTPAATVATLIGAELPYTLTVNLRSPRAVFERVHVVVPAAFQQSSPREHAPDTLVEQVEGDPWQQLTEAILTLHNEGTPASAITVISIDIEPELSPALRELVHEVIPIHKYRGLEAPVVIVFAVGRRDVIDDLVLACAYTRATTRCIGIYHILNVLSARDTAWNTHLLATQPRVRATLDDLWPPPVMRSNTAVITTPARIDWLPAWNSWVLVREWTDDVVVQKLWLSHLLATSTYAVYDMVLTYPGHMFMTNAQGEYASAWPRTMYHWDWCQRCQQWGRSIRSANTRRCLECTMARPAPQAPPTQARDLMHYAAILNQPDRFTADERRCLPIALVAIGRWRAIAAEQQALLLPRLSSGSCAGFFMSKVLTGIDVARAVPDTIVRLDEMQARYQERYPALVHAVDDHVWRQWISRSVATWIHHGLLRKEARGVYRRVPDGQHRS